MRAEDKQRDVNIRQIWQVRLSNHTTIAKAKIPCSLSLFLSRLSFSVCCSAGPLLGKQCDDIIRDLRPPELDRVILALIKRKSPVPDDGNSTPHSHWPRILWSNRRSRDMLFHSESPPEKRRTCFVHPCSSRSAVPDPLVDLTNRILGVPRHLRTGQKWPWMHR